MPEYEFEDAKGRRVTRFLSMEEAPQIGAVIEGGLTRVPSSCQVPPQKDVSFVSETLPLHWPYAKRHDSEGRCVFGSRDEVNEAVRKSANSQHDKVVYDP